MRAAFRTWRLTFALIALAGSLATVALARESVPSRPDRLPPGILIEPEQSRAVLPGGVKLRVVTAAGLKLTQDSEGWSAKLYDDSAGYCTIGYGHLIRKARCDGTESQEFRQGISQTRGAELLIRDMTQAEIAVMLAVENTLNDNQYAALCDFVFNVGAENFRQSTLLKRINDGQFEAVPAQLGRWTKAGGNVFPGLVKRRKGEAALFFAGQPVPRPVPSDEEDLSPIDILSGEGGKK